MTRVCSITLAAAVSFMAGCSSGSRLPVGQVPDGASGGMAGAGTGGMTGAGSGGTTGAGTGGMDARSGGGGTGGVGTDGAATMVASTTPETGPSADAADAADSGRPVNAPADAGPIAAGCEGCLKFTQCCMAVRPGASNCTASLDFCNSYPTVSQRQGMSRDCLTMMNDAWVRPRMNLGAPVPAACQ